ncbi:MAG: hypothetical protein KDI36_10620 [Pseudomonadales bacterium]|nr:hypothetical protein [Pseudomonadales bacterium]
MTGWLLTLLALAGAGFGLRALRRREKAAFLDADNAALRQLRKEQGLEEIPAPAVRLSQVAPEAARQSVPEVQPARLADPVRDVPLQATALHDGLSAHYLTLLEQILPRELRAVPSVAVAEFISGVDPSRHLRLSVLICDRQWLPVAGIAIGATQSVTEELETLLGAVGLPLYRFSGSAVGASALTSALAPTLEFWQRTCPACAKPMRQKGLRGRDSRVWVCRSYPECRTVIPVSPPQ